MKFFAEFGSCCGGATVTPTADSAAIPSQQEVAPPLNSAGNSQSSSRRSGRFTKANSAHWKPALSAISEDSVFADIGSRRNQRTARSQKKTLEKARSVATVGSPSHSDDYRNDPMLMALPAFSPTPFLF